MIEASPHQCGKRDTGEDTVATLDRNPTGASQWATTPVRAYRESCLGRLPYSGKPEVPGAIVSSAKAGDLAVGIAREPDRRRWHHERIVECGP